MAVASRDHEWRFSLRTVFIATLCIAILAANWKWLWYFGVMGQLRPIFWPALGLFAAIAWNAGQSGPPSLVPKKLVAKFIAIAWISWWSLVTIYLLWVSYRWRQLARLGKLQPFPYPDQALIDFHSWLDRQYPVEPGYIKMHGEVDFVHVIVNYCAWIAAVILAFQVGLLFRIDRRALLERVRSVVSWIRTHRSEK